MLLNNYQIKEDIEKRIKRYIEITEMKYDIPKFWGSSSSTKRKAYTNTGLPQERRKGSNKKSNIIPESMIKRRTNEIQSQQEDENNKNQSGNK